MIKSKGQELVARELQPRAALWFAILMVIC
jgi:hypothetical protein